MNGTNIAWYHRINNADYSKIVSFDDNSRSVLAYHNGGQIYKLRYIDNLNGNSVSGFNEVTLNNNNETNHISSTRLT